jgi:hypothetical protein
MQALATPDCGRKDRCFTRVTLLKITFRRKWSTLLEKSQNHLLNDVFPVIKSSALQETHTWEFWGEFLKYA